VAYFLTARQFATWRYKPFPLHGYEMRGYKLWGQKMFKKKKEEIIFNYMFPAGDTCLLKRLEQEDFDFELSCYDVKLT
jgi:hypothetical protein